MWEERSILELAADEPHAVNGGPFGSKLGRKDYVDEGVPVIRGVNLPADRRFAYDGLVFVSEDKADELRANLARPRDVVVTQRGTIGQVGIIPADSPYSDFVISQSQMKLTVNVALADPDFIFYSLRSPGSVRRLQDLAMSAGVPHINLEMFRNFRLKVPPLPVQRKIAAVLAAYDELIENNLRRIEILDEMAQAVYREWFVNFRYPGHENVPLVDSPLGPIPEGWEVAKLSDFTTTQYGYTASTDEKPAGPRFLRGMDFNKRPWIDWSEVPYCTISDADLAKYKVEVGDVLVIRMADPGKVAIVEKSVEAVFASYVVRVRPDIQRALPYWLFYYMSSPAYQRYISGAGTGTTRKSASASVLTGSTMALPPLIVQAHFIDVVVPLRKLLNNLIDQNANLRTTRDLLLPKLVSGEIDVSELDIDTEWLAS